MDAIEERKHNEEKFLAQLAKFSPELLGIHYSLSKTKINPLVVPFVIDKIYEVADLTGHGEVKIIISNGKVSIEAIPRKPKTDFEINILV